MLVAVWLQMRYKFCKALSAVPPGLNSITMKIDLHPHVQAPGIISLLKSLTSVIFFSK